MTKSTTTKEDGKCTGQLAIEGYEGGSVDLISGNRWANKSSLDERTVIARGMGGRIYFAESCSRGDYDNSEYLALQLLGKRISYTTDMSGAGCGCNVGFYLVSMRQNENPSDCEDYYCDANSDCGVPCSEIDIQEGNLHAWFTTFHLADDADGSVIGYGGDMGKPDYRDWGRDEYSP